MIICHHFSFTNKNSYGKARCNEKKYTNDDVHNYIYDDCRLKIDYFILIIGTSTNWLKWKSKFQCSLPVFPKIQHYFILVSMVVPYMNFIMKTQLTWALNFSKPMRIPESKAWLTAIRTIKSSFIVLILFQTQINMNLVIVTITIITTPNQSTIFVNAIWVWQRNTGSGPKKTRRFLIPQTTMP